ncbi:Retrovirus-related Pol polyprotein from transposon TNT 1-94 [Senna tora]|uniref:Retrovirus-related Pol polyprotein from transposon TNT 1-94 n=1 Tax=Senna tora TaxID=362788 RepID=A0A834XAZ9_9FABA|nr:Retrovirus-related Pol polyprotein from transposon TNT 1-94 [Senna tora]
MPESIGETHSNQKSTTESGSKGTMSVEVPKFSQGFSQPISNKLDDQNYLTWRMQVNATIKGHKLGKFLVAKYMPPQFLTPEDAVADNVNPEFVEWESQDQLLVAWLLNSMTDAMTNKMVGCTYTHQILRKIEELFLSQTRAKERSLRTQLRNTKKAGLGMSEFLLKIKKIVDSLAAIGSPISDHEYTEILLDALPNSISANISQTKPSSQNFKSSQNSQNQNSGNYRPPNPSFRGGQSRGQGRNNRGGRNSWQQNNNRPQCQLCGWQGHVAMTCFHRFDQSFTAATRAQVQPPFRPNSNTPVEALIAAPETLYDAAWYPDSGASNHITNDASNLQNQQIYTGQDQVHTANGSVLNISHVGYSKILTSSDKLLSLTNLFHVPTVTKNLLSVSKCAQDNDVYFVFTADSCVVKSQATHQVLLKGRMSNGLYLFDELPLTHKITPSNVSATSANALCAHNSDSISLNTWHCRLGHPSKNIVQTVLSTCNFKPIHSKSNPFCESCCLGKLHSISFPASDTVYSRPLELVYSDVWGPTPVLSSRGYRYYIVFIDACTKFTWFYLLTAKSDALLAFKQFKTLAENQLNTTLKSFQSDFGGEFRSFIPFLNEHARDDSISHDLLSSSPPILPVTTNSSSIPLSDSAGPLVNTHPMQTRAKSGIFKPKVLSATIEPGSDLLSRAGLTDAKPQRTPMVSGLKLSAKGDDPFSNPTHYRSIVGVGSLFIGLTGKAGVGSASRVPILALGWEKGSLKSASIVSVVTGIKGSGSLLFLEFFPPFGVAMDLEASILCVSIAIAVFTDFILLGRISFLVISIVLALLCFCHHKTWCLDSTRVGHRHILHRYKRELASHGPSRPSNDGAYCNKALLNLLPVELSSCAFESGVEVRSSAIALASCSESHAILEL